MFDGCFLLRFYAHGKVHSLPRPTARHWDFFFLSAWPSIRQFLHFSCTSGQPITASGHLTEDRTHKICNPRPLIGLSLLPHRRPFSVCPRGGQKSCQDSLSIEYHHRRMRNFQNQGRLRRDRRSLTMRALHDHHHGRVRSIYPFGPIDLFGVGGVERR